MDRTSTHALYKRVSKGLVATCVALCLLLITSVTALANSVNIYDRGNILNASQVRNEASSLPKPIDIYTIPNFTGSNQAFVNNARQSVNNPDKIVMAIKPGYMTVVGGKNVGLSNSQYTDSVNAFISSYNGNRNYTSATIAAIQSLRNNLSSGGFLPAVGGGTGIFGTVCCIGLIVLVIIAVFAFVRRRNRGGGLFGGFRGNPNPPVYNQPYNSPYNQGAYPPNYQGQYPPNYQGPYPPQQGGINPLAAGGLGAAAGGLLGYELGKNAGEREHEREGGYYGGDQGGNYDVGGGAGGSFGGGDGGGFGGDQGGGAGGSFGGGDGGGFGGGGFGGDSGGGGFGGGDGGGFGGGDGGSF
ncbi:MAG: hypothetical protein NVS2B12_14760 [Ktedonobacteraceae bacterium]